MIKKEQCDPIANMTRKKDFINVRGYLDLRTAPPIKLEIKATPDEWEAFRDYILDGYYLSKPNMHLLHELLAIADCAIQSLEEKKPRGKNKKSHKLVEKIKEESAFLFAFLKYWCKKQPLGKWPKPLKDIIELAKREDIDCKLGKSGNRYDPQVLTAFCIDKVHGTEAKKVGLKPLFESGKRDSIDNFYFTYIQDKRLPREVEKSSIEGKTSDEIEQRFYSLLKGDVAFYYSFPLRDLFEIFNQIFLAKR